jgi:hypothetical protein
LNFGQPKYLLHLLGTKKNTWPSAVKSALKDAELFFDVLNKRWRYIINTVNSLDTSNIENICVACPILHTMLLDHDDLDNWEHHMRRCRFKRGFNTVDLTTVQVSCHHMMDNIVYNQGHTFQTRSIWVVKRRLFLAPKKITRIN